MKKFVVATLLTCIITFLMVYALIQTRSGLAVLTTPPPGIPGPYYVTAEAKIYGPVVDLATIKSKMDGEYASDYTYVQWGTNPFYRVYVDNTLQEVYYGQMIDVMEKLSNNFQIDSNLINTHNDMKNVGAVYPESHLGNLHYFGNMPGVFIAISGLTQSPSILITRTSCWYATEGYLQTHSGWNVDLNDTRCLSLDSQVSGGARKINATGHGEGLYNWTITCWRSGKFSGTFYFKDLLYFDTDINSHNYRVYTVLDSPGTGYVTKSIYPASPVAGSTVNVTVRLDPPSAEIINITDFYPNTFTWASVDVLLKKFKVGTGLEESAYVNVVPVPEGSNMTFTTYYNQAPNILQSLQSDEYIYLTYSLRVPDIAGEYTLPSATMSYLIPTPET